MEQANISKAFQAIRLNSIKSSPLQLKPGQLIMGKIEKFLPQNKAIIQLAQQTVIAQLANQLQANQRYIFQVKHVVPFIKLQVMSEKPIRREKDSVSILLAKMGLKNTETSFRFLSELIDGQLPLNQEKISIALNILDEAPNPGRGIQILKEMLQRELPITKEVFQALYTRTYESLDLSKIAKLISERLQNVDMREAKQLRSFLSLFYEGNRMDQQESIVMRLKAFISLLSNNTIGEGKYNLLSLLNIVNDHLETQSAQTEMKQLIHILNAMNLAMNEKNEWHQFSIQFPGALFDLDSDLLIDFEGRREADGKMNPSYCRIMFYLELGALKETIIDMKVQNKVINLSVYHEQPSTLLPLVKQLQSSLINGMKKIDYKVSSVSVNPLQKNDSNEGRSAFKSQPVIGKGVDFHI
jgi:hypothetical protein